MLNSAHRHQSRAVPTAASESDLVAPVTMRGSHVLVCPLSELYTAALYSL